MAANTPLLHKVVDYGSEMANGLFTAGVSAHVVTGVIATVAGVAALALPKGKRRHIWWGTLFVQMMIVTSLIGAAVDIVRLTIKTDANHAVRSGFTRAARLALLRQAT